MEEGVNKEIENKSNRVRNKKRVGKNIVLESEYQEFYLNSRRIGLSIYPGEGQLLHIVPMPKFHDRRLLYGIK